MPKKTIAFKTGPFNIRLRTNHIAFYQIFHKLYPHIPTLAVSPSETAFHYQIDIFRPNNLRRFIQPQVEFLIDQIRPFEPYPNNHFLPLFEWGLNWVIAMTAHQFLMLHSAALEYRGIGCIFPAMPGSGKSTLCAALSYKGWRLLSDEFGLINHRSLQILPMPRAIGLKNESIPIIKEYLPEAFVGPSFYNTRKGTVAHVAPSRQSLQDQDIPANPRLIIFPRYLPENQCRLKKISRSLAFTKLANNAFNYQISMRNGFQSLSHLINQCDAYTLEYHLLDQGIETLNQLLHEKYI